MFKSLLNLALSVLVLVVLSVGSFVGYQQYSGWKKEQRYLLLYQEAVVLLDEGHAEESLELLEANFDDSLASDALSDWPSLMTRAALESRNYSYLDRMVADYPDLLLEQEDLVLWWGRAQIHRGQWSTMGALLDHWSPDQRQMPDRWNILEADRLLLEKRVDEARASLNSWTGEGRDEANRQLRLAILAGGNSREVLKALNATYAALPDSADVRAIAAQLIEQLGNNVLARREYVAAYLMEPDSPFYGDLLAEFYRRMLAMPQAVETWREVAVRTEDPRIWWKAWFWERVTTPRGESLTPPSGEWWGNLASEIAGASEDQFLSDEFLVKNFSAPPILAPSEAYHWIWLLQLLQNGNESGALEVLENMPTSSHAIAPNLRTLLQALLDWRLRENWPRGILLSDSRPTHRYMKFLGEFRPTHVPAEVDDLTALEQFLVSDWSIPALFLSEGWLGAAYRLQPGACPPELLGEQEALNWIPYASIRMVATFAGDEAALKWASNYPGDLAVQGQVAELMIRSGQIESGLARLESLAQLEGPSGYRAAYLRALAALDLSDYGLANRLITQRQDLANSVSGRELLARSALKQGQPERALEIYRSLDSASLEGLVYRYQVAIEQSDLTLARELVDTLLLIAPYEVRFLEWRSGLDAQDTD